jgi:hypothetical protein
MTMAVLLIPLSFFVVGVALLLLAMTAPAREGACDRIRRLEELARTSQGLRAAQGALHDPDPRVAAVAAILLRDAIRGNKPG